MWLHSAPTKKHKKGPPPPRPSPGAPHSRANVRRRPPLSGGGSIQDGPAPGYHHGDDVWEANEGAVDGLAYRKGGGLEGG